MRGALLFARRAFADLGTTGAVVPSSRALAEVLAEGIEATRPPRRVLEVGGGTGAVTCEIVRRLEPGDRLVVYEIDPALAGYIARRPEVASADGRVEIRCDDVRAMPPPAAGERFGAIVASLPFQSLPAEAVGEVWKTLFAALAPGGTISFFRYAFFPAVWAALPTAAGRRMRAARSALDAAVDGRVIDRRFVAANFPPAWAIRVAMGRP